MSKSSTFPIDRNLSGGTTLGKSGPGSDVNEGIFHIPQHSSITEASSSDFLVSYAGYSGWESYTFVEMQSVYSTASANWARSVFLFAELNKLRRKEMTMF